MSVKPLDLQVNINSLQVTSQKEGARVASSGFAQRLMDEKAMDDAKKNLEQVNKSPEATESEYLKEEGQLIKEEERKKSSKKEQNKKRKKKKSWSDEESSSPDDEYYIDTMA